MKNTLKQDNLKEWLLDKKHLALPVLLLFFLIFVTISQLPITLAQEDEAQAEAGAFITTITAEPAEGGNVSGDGAYDEGSEAGLTAAADEDYSFSGWFEDGELNSADAELSFVVTVDRVLVARFEQEKLDPVNDPEPDYHTIEQEENETDQNLLYALMEEDALNDEIETEAIIERNKDDKVKASFSTITNTIPGNNSEVIPFQKWSWHEVRQINVKLVDVITGEQANSIVQYENMFNDVPTSSQEWRIYHFDLTYVSGTTGGVLKASDVLFYRDFFRPTGSSLPSYDRATWSREYRPHCIFRVELYPGGSSRVIVGLLVDKSEPVPLLRVPYNAGNSNNWINLTLADNYTLTVNSTNPTSGVAITSSSGHGGTTQYSHTLATGTSATLTAPEYVGSGADRKRFDRWSGSSTSTNRTITLTMSADLTVTANYVDDPESGTGSIQVFIEPAAARVAGAQWRLASSSSNNITASGSLPPDPPTIDLAEVPYEAMESNLFRVKFKPEISRTLDQVKVTTSGAGIAVTGITEVDTLNKKYGASAFTSMLEPLYTISKASNNYRDRHREYGLHLWYEIRIDAKQDIKEVITAYSSLDQIEIAEPLYKIIRTTLGPIEIDDIKPAGDLGGDIALQSTWSPNDPRFNDQWHYHNTGQNSGTAGADIDLIRAWDIEKGNPNVIVAIVDDGVQFNHPDLSGNMWSGIGPDGTHTIPDNHGTHVAGTVAAVSNNSTGVAGIAGGSGSGNGVRLMSVDAFEGSLSHSHLLIYTYQADNGVAISQNSWAFEKEGVFPADAKAGIDYFIANGGGNVLDGGLAIFAAGNDNSSGSLYPPRYAGVMAVAATNNQDKKADYSNYGSWIEISAPGGEMTYIGDPRGVLSTTANNGYAYHQGTSMAAPHVSGVAALMVSNAPGQYTATEIRSMLKNSADNHDVVNPSYAGQLGSGRLNAYQALLSAQHDAWLNSGETITGLDPGYYTINFKDVIDWSKPADITLTVGDEAKTVTANYIDDKEKDLIILPDQQNIEVDQMWRINFNREFSKDEVEDIYIDEVMLFSAMTDGSEKFVNVEVEWLPEEKQAIITPKEDYESGETYHLIMILSNDNRYRMKFTVAAN